MSDSLELFLEQLESTILKARVSGTDDTVDVLVDAGYDGEWFSGYRWTINPLGYVTAAEKGFSIKDPGGKNNRVYLHHLVLPPKKGYWRTFKNGNKLDCRSSNVIYRTSRESAAARPLGMTNRSGFVGVYAYQTIAGIIEGRYRAKHNNKYLGVYATPEEAARAHDKAAIEDGNARLNYPDEVEKTKSMVLNPLTFEKRHYSPRTVYRPPNGEDHVWVIRNNESFKVLMDPEDVVRLGHLKFTAKIGGLIITSFGKQTSQGYKRSTLSLKRLILPDTPDGQYIYNKNGDKLDCRKENLTTERPAYKRGARGKYKMSNKPRKPYTVTARSNKLTGYIGVLPVKSHSGVIIPHLFRAYSGKAYLGQFRTAEAAARARDKYVKRWRPGTELNFKEEES